VASSLIGFTTLLVMYVGRIRSFDVTNFVIDALFLVGAALTGVAFILDLAMVGSGAGTLQLVRNAVFAAAKWLLLYALLPVLPSPNEVGVLASWVAGLTISFAILAFPATSRRLPAASSRPDWAALRSLRGATSAHNAFNLAGQIPRLLLPVMATSLISPAAGATFFIAWMMAGFLYIVPTHLSTALFAIGAGRLSELGEKLRFSFRLSLVLGAMGGPLLAVLAPPLLQLFGSSYSTDGAVSLRILCIAYLPMVVKTHYVAVVRVQRRLAKGSLVAVSGAALELIGASVGAVTHGVTGLSAGLLIGLTIESAIMGPTLLRAWLLPARGITLGRDKRVAEAAVRHQAPRPTN